MPLDSAAKVELYVSENKCLLNFIRKITLHILTEWKLSVNGASASVVIQTWRITLAISS